jgi:hypothetical protein
MLRDSDGQRWCANGNAAILLDTRLQNETAQWARPWTAQPVPVLSAHCPPDAPSGSGSSPESGGPSHESGGPSHESGVSSQFPHPAQPRRANCLNQQRSELVMNCEIAPIILICLGTGLT